MVRLMGLLRSRLTFEKSSKALRGSNSRTPSCSQPFKPSECKTEYLEVPELDLANLWLQNNDPSLLQSPEIVAMQVASLTMFAAETLDRLKAIEARQQNER